MLSGPLSRPRAGKGRFDARFTLLSRSQYAQLKESTHSPLYALTRLRHAVETALITPVSVPCTTAEDGGSTNARCKQYLIYPHPHMMSHSLFGVTEDILGALTGCERILRTPLPPGYVGVLRILMILFLTVLPFSLVESLRWGVVPIHMVLSYVILEVEETAVQIEQPFGFEYNDLPIDVYCLRSKRMYCASSMSHARKLTARAPKAIGAVCGRPWCLNHPSLDAAGGNGR